MSQDSKEWLIEQKGKNQREIPKLKEYFKRNVKERQKHLKLRKSLSDLIFHTLISYREDPGDTSYILFLCKVTEVGSF